MPAWTTPTMVADALGASAAPPVDDTWLIMCCDAANAAAWRKRYEAGYDDDPADTADAPDAAVALGTTYWARDLWRSRGATDSPTSYEELQGFTPSMGSWPDIKKLLGIGRGAVDAIPLDLQVNPLLLRARRRRRLARLRAMP